MLRRWLKLVVTGFLVVALRAVLRVKYCNDIGTSVVVANLVESHKEVAEADGHKERRVGKVKLWMIT